VTDSARRSAADAWAFRAKVEQEAAVRFDRLAAVIAEFDPGSPVPGLMRRAADDERRHTQLCAELARSLGASLSLGEAAVPDIAPRHLDRRQTALYEVVAAACITETESMSTLATLLEAGAEPPVQEVLNAIARDEVVHSRMGWAHLSREAERGDVTFLSDLIPVMLGGTVDEDLFGQPPADEDPQGLLRLGVLPHARKREVFVGTLTNVVFPGLDRFGVDTRPARAWLAERTAAPG
jgi:rubrerythrin